MYQIRVVRHFEASHGLRNFKGSDEPIHTHRFRLEVTAQATHVDDSGCAIDFHEVDQAINTILISFEGKSFNETLPFQTTSPSAENIARYFFGLLSQTLNSPDLSVRCVTVGEDEDHCASYFE